MNKQLKYQALLPQIKSLIENESDLIANLSNISSAIHFAFNFHWTGFYIVKNQVLVLGPFQGPVACTRINYGKGVCGASWEKKSNIIVDNVHLFEGHIACSAHSQSEIVIPIYSDSNEVWGILDIDSDKLSNFDSIDELYLCEICKLIKIPIK